MRSLLIALVSLAVLPTSALAQTPDVSGWWRAELERAGETTDFYLHFDEENGRSIVRFSAPVVRMHDAPIGRFEVHPSEVRLTSVGWTLTLSGDGAAMEGVLPHALVPVHEIAARFVRSEAPPAPVEITAQSDAPRPQWTTSVGAPVWAGLTHDRGRNLLHVAANDGRVHALDAATGATRWTTNLDAPIRATPTLAGRRLFVATDAALVALDAVSGARIWSASFGTERAARLPISDQNSSWDHYSSAPAIDRGEVFVGARDGCVYALVARTGRQRWRTCTEMLITTTPAVTRDVVYIGGFDGAAYALSRRDGAVLWRRDLSAPIPRDPIIAGETVIFGSRSYDLVALDARTGETSWSRYFWFSWIDSPPVIEDGVLFIGSSDLLAVQAMDAATGRAIWATAVPGWSWPRVAVGHERVYAALVGGAYMSPRLGGLAAMDRSAGGLTWMLSATPAPDGEIYGFAASPVVSNGRLFAADLAGTVYAFED